MVDQTNILNKPKNSAFSSDKTPYSLKNICCGGETKLAIGLMGCGSMGGAIADGLILSKTFKPNEILVSCKSSDTKTKLEKRGLRVTLNNQQIARDCNIIIVAVEPGYVHKVLAESLKEQTTKPALLISVCAAVTIKFLEKIVPPNYTVIRSMPNKTCASLAGLTPYCCADPSEYPRNLFKKLFDPLGSTVEVPEHLMHIATALSGSSPTYFYMMLEAMIDAGVLHGMSRDVAKRLSIHALNGAAKALIQTNEEPVILKNTIVSPGGLTAAALAEFEKHNLRFTGFPETSQMKSRYEALRISQTSSVSNENTPKKTDNAFHSPSFRPWISSRHGQYISNDLKDSADRMDGRGGANPDTKQELKMTKLVTSAKNLVNHYWSNHKIAGSELAEFHKKAQDTSASAGDTDARKFFPECRDILSLKSESKKALYTLKPSVHQYIPKVHRFNVSSSDTRPGRAFRKYRKSGRKKKKKKRRSDWWPEVVGNSLCITPDLYEATLCNVKAIRSYLLGTSHRYRARVENTFGEKICEKEILQPEVQCDSCQHRWPGNVVAAFEMISVDIPRTMPRFGYSFTAPSKTRDPAESLSAQSSLSEQQSISDLRNYVRNELHSVRLPENESPITSRNRTAQSNSESDEQYIGKEEIQSISSDDTTFEIMEQSHIAFPSKTCSIADESSISITTGNFYDDSDQSAIISSSLDPQALYMKLRTLLEVFVLMRPDVGYVQGMAYIASMFLFFVDDDYKAFTCFANLIVREDLYSLYTFKQLDIEAVFYTYEALLQEKCPEIAKFIDKAQLRPAQFLTDWVFTLFTRLSYCSCNRSLPLDILCEVWDNILGNGSAAVYQYTLTLLHFLYQQINFHGDVDPRDQLLELVSSSNTKHYDCFNRAVFFSGAQKFVIPARRIRKYYNRYLKKQLELEYNQWELTKAALLETNGNPALNSKESIDKLEDSIDSNNDPEEISQRKNLKSLSLGDKCYAPVLEPVTQRLASCEEELSRYNIAEETFLNRKLSLVHGIMSKLNPQTNK